MISPPLVRSRANWVWVAAMIGAASFGVVFLWRADRSAAKLTPGLYLIASDGPVAVRVGFRTRQLLTSLSVAAGKTLTLKEGVQLDALYPDGHRQHLTGPLKIELPKTKVVDGNFFTNPLLQVLNTPQNSTVRTTLIDGPNTLIKVTSPSGVTRFLNPVINWQTKDEQRYDLAVVDLADDQAPPRIINGMRPPVSLASLQTTQGTQLSPDRLYGVIIRLSNDKAVQGSSRFLTRADAIVGELPGEPAKLLEEAADALLTEPSRIGDAWQSLSMLPADWQKSELAVRLRLRVAEDLHLPDAFAAAKADAKILAHR